MGSRSVAESAAKYSGEMSVVAKAAVVGDLTDRLAGVQPSRRAHIRANWIVDGYGVPTC
jgi:hypothetical protein